MKNIFITFYLLIGLGSFNLVYAQKAYDEVIYRANIKNNLTVLKLADGYLLASKLIIHSKLGNLVFAPDASEADKKGNLQFKAINGSGRYKRNKNQWFMLADLNSVELPSQIKAIYWDGKTKRMVIFYRNG